MYIQNATHFSVIDYFPWTANNISYQSFYLITTEPNEISRQI